MKLLLVFAVVFVVAHAASIEEQWQEFKLNHGKTYKSLLEEKRRFAIFQDNVRQFEEHNAKFAKGEIGYSVGINQFTDLTDEEFFKAYLTPIKPKSLRKVVAIYNDTSLDLGVESVNWVSKGLVTPVKDQGQCGSCWAFSTVGSIEGQVAKNGGALESLSAQNLVDCDTAENEGCQGGQMVEAFKYIENNGVLPESEYPYVGYRRYCHKKGGQKVSGYVEIAENEAALLSALSKVGPISVAMEAEKLSRYSGGIFDPRSGCTEDINHGVLAVGAGTENGKDYWLIKNSWGARWGLQGYFKLARGQNACGINLDNSYPKL